MAKDKNLNVLVIAAVVIVAFYALAKWSETQKSKYDAQAEVQLDCQKRFGCQLNQILGTVGGYIFGPNGLF